MNEWQEVQWAVVCLLETFGLLDHCAYHDYSTSYKGSHGTTNFMSQQELNEYRRRVALSIAVQRRNEKQYSRC